MLFFNRAASVAVACLSAALLVSGTTPGLAKELEAPKITTTTLNALTMPAVPTAAPAPTPALPTVSFAAAQEVVQPLPQPAVLQQDLTDTAEQETPSFDSLAAAVAAQDADAMDREMTCLAAGVYFESKGEPLAGQLAVAETIINRTKSGRFAKSICGVLTQRGQFSFVRGGYVPTAEGRKGWATAVAVSKVALRDLWNSPASSALYFHARRVGSQGWRATKIASIGNHVFYR
jgi:spore germination cell wall hydrolase CwlJ-like protein